MNKVNIILLKIITSTIITTTLFSQNYNRIHQPHIRSNNGGNVSIKFHDFGEKYCIWPLMKFNSEKWIKFKNSDSIEKILTNKYPNIFKQHNNGLVFRSINGKIFVTRRHFIDKDDERENYKQYSDYKIESRFDDIIIISETGYESWNTVIVDLKTNLAYILPSNPIFINSNILYSWGNYYGDCDITIINLEKKSDISISYYGIEIDESTYSINNNSDSFKLFFNLNHDFNRSKTGYILELNPH